MSKRTSIEKKSVVIKMPSTAIEIKPINTVTTVKEKEYVEEIERSLSRRPVESACAKNRYAIELLKKARQG